MNKKNRSGRKRKPTVKPKLAPQLEVPRPATTTWMSFAFVPGFPNHDPRSAIMRSPEGSPGVYKVVLILCVPGKATFHDALDFLNLARSGDSLLHIGNGVEIDFTITSGDIVGPATFTSNANGALSTIQMRVQAQSFQEARIFAYNMVAPCLSYWSYRYDIALDIKGYEMIEELTGTRQYMLGVLGQAKGLNLQDNFIFDQEFRSLLAIYREAMNSTNLFYKVLSFYKVTEGVKNLLDERRKQVLAKGESWTNPVERIPNNLDDIATDQWDKHSLTPYIGKKFTSVLDHYRSLIRNAVAHLDPTSRILDADTFQDIGTCEDAVPVLKYIARQMLDAELQARTAISSPESKDEKADDNIPEESV